MIVAIVLFVCALLLPSTPAFAGTDPSGSPAPTTHLNNGPGYTTLLLVIGVMVLASLFVVYGRRAFKNQAKDAIDTTIIRSWLAVTLVGGLLILVAASFFFDDTALRSALVGGVVASAGAAVAFYFASKDSDQVRRDILTAALGFSSPATTIAVNAGDGQNGATGAALAIEPSVLVTDARGAPSPVSALVSTWSMVVARSRTRQQRQMQTASPRRAPGRWVTRGSTS
jgi:hypothetical protein